MRLQVIEGLDFEVNDGEFVAIVGPSGCGKTTLMNIIAGFLAPDSGAVNVNGVVRNGPNRKGIMITQQGSVFPWLTVKQNLLFGLPDEVPNREALADEYAALVGLKGFENNYPHELSGGMLKRAEIARALVVKPEILYMDEPFSALDALMSLRMQNELLRILAIEKTHGHADHARRGRSHSPRRPDPGAEPAPGAHPGFIRGAFRASAASLEPRGAGAACGDPQGAGRHGIGVSGLAVKPQARRVLLSAPVFRSSHEFIDSCQPLRLEAAAALVTMAASASEPAPQRFAGVDLSYVNEVEACGAQFRLNGQLRDPYELFAERGANLVRLRLWNDPTWTNYSTESDVTRSMERAKKAGMHVLLDFHYSDDWADPQKQTIPAAWAADIGDADKLALACLRIHARCARTPPARAA